MSSLHDFRIIDPWGSLRHRRYVLFLSVESVFLKFSGRRSFATYFVAVKISPFHGGKVCDLSHFAVFLACTCPVRWVPPRQRGPWAWDAWYRSCRWRYCGDLESLTPCLVLSLVLLGGSLDLLGDSLDLLGGSLDLLGMGGDVGVHGELGWWRMYEIHSRRRR